WLLDSPLGIHKFSINDPYVKPDSVVLYVDKPVANLPFESIETYTISGRVNGNCGVSVGPANISVYNDTKCFNKTILTNPDGSYTFDAVPPLGIVTMEVKPLNQLITFDPLYFYFDQDTIIDFT